MAMDNIKLGLCSECGKLIPKRGNETLCTQCLEKHKSASLHEKETPSKKIILPQHIDEETNSIEENTEVSGETQKTVIRMCSVCGKYRALPNRDLCLNCTLDMYKGFQNAVKEISDKIAKSSTEKPQWEHETFVSARRMEPFRRLRTQGLTWIKGYNLH